MGMIKHPNNELGITDELKEAFAQATPFEIRLATAYIHYPSRKDALQAIGAKPELEEDVVLWSNVAKLNYAIGQNLMRSAIPMMEQYIPQAVQVLMNGLQSTSERTRLSTAKYILERFLGKPTAHTKLDIQATQATVHYIQGIDPDKDWDVIEGEYDGD